MSRAPRPQVATPVLREQRRAEAWQGTSWVLRGAGVGVAVVLIGAPRGQAVENSVPVWHLWNAMAYLSKAEERKRQKTYSKGAEDSVTADP